MLIRLSPATLLCIVVGSASAQSAPRSACLDTATTQSAMTHCSGEYYEATLRNLDGVLARARSSMDLSRAALLDSSQVAWRAYAEVHCEFEGSAVAGGSMYPMTVLNCLADLTLERTRSIEALTLLK